MAHWNVFATITSLGALAIVGVIMRNDAVTFLAAGALAGYLGKVNGNPSDSRPPVD